MKYKPVMSHVIDVQIPATEPPYNKSLLPTLPSRGPGLVKKIESSQKDTKSLMLPQSPTPETVTSSPGLAASSHTAPTKPAPYIFASPGTESGQVGRPSSPCKRVVTMKSRESSHREGVGGEGEGGGGEGAGGEAVLRGAGEEVATSDGPGELES